MENFMNYFKAVFRLIRIVWKREMKLSKQSKNEK